MRPMLHRLVASCADGGRSLPHRPPSPECNGPEHQDRSQPEQRDCQAGPCSPVARAGRRERGDDGGWRRGGFDRRRGLMRWTVRRCAGRRARRNDGVRRGTGGCIGRCCGRGIGRCCRWRVGRGGCCRWRRCRRIGWGIGGRVRRDHGCRDGRGCPEHDCRRCPCVGGCTAIRVKDFDRSQADVIRPWLHPRPGGRDDAGAASGCGEWGGYIIEYLAGGAGDVTAGRGRP